MPTWWPPPSTSRSPERSPRSILRPPSCPYLNVHDAIVDGWRVVHFPQQRAPFDDREIDVLGQEFILEKLEEFDD